MRDQKSTIFLLDYVALFLMRRLHDVVVSATAFALVPGSVVLIALSRAMDGEINSWHDISAAWHIREL
jgi:hypothetical protein